jgi:hypothetical protein
MASCELVGGIDSQFLEWGLLWRDLDPMVRPMVSDAASEHKVSERDLLVSTRLHLPRLTIQELSSSPVVRSEIERIAHRIETTRSFYPRPAPTRMAVLTKSSVSFSRIDAEIARVIHERFHYVGSFREGVHFGLFEKGRQDPSELPITMATFSELDVQHLKDLMFGHDNRYAGLLLSRVYSFDHAWRNSTSYLLAMGAAWLRRNRPDVRTLFTYVNPNLGFTGVSYRASNWTEVGEKAISYRYLRDQYLSARRYAVVDVVDVPVIRRAIYHLLPLKIWSYTLPTKELDRD